MIIAKLETWSIYEYIFLGTWNSEKYNIAYINARHTVCMCKHKVTWWISEGTKTNIVWAENEWRNC